MSTSLKARLRGLEQARQAKEPSYPDFGPEAYAGMSEEEWLLAAQKQQAELAELEAKVLGPSRWAKPPTLAA